MISIALGDYSHVVAGSFRHFTSPLTARSLGQTRSAISPRQGWAISLAGRGSLRFWSTRKSRMRFNPRHPSAYSRNILHQSESFRGHSFHAMRWYRAMNRYSRNIPACKILHAWRSHTCGRIPRPCANYTSSIYPYRVHRAQAAIVDLVHIFPARCQASVIVSNMSCA